MYQRKPTKVVTHPSEDTWDKRSAPGRVVVQINDGVETETAASPRRYDAPGLSYSTSMIEDPSYVAEASYEDETSLDISTFMMSEPREDCSETSSEAGHRTSDAFAKQASTAEQFFAAFTDEARRASANFAEQTTSTSQKLFSAVTDEARRASMSVALAKQTSNETGPKPRYQSATSRRQTFGGTGTNIFNYLYQECADEDQSINLENNEVRYEEPEDEGIAKPSPLISRLQETPKVKNSFRRNTDAALSFAEKNQSIDNPISEDELRATSPTNQQREMDELDELVDLQTSMEQIEKPRNVIRSILKHPVFSGKRSSIKTPPPEMPQIVEEDSPEKAIVHSPKGEDPSIEVDQGEPMHSPTPSVLHQFCLTVTKASALKEAKGLISAQTASESDHRGRLAMHCIGENLGLAESIAYPDEANSQSTPITRRPMDASPTSVSSQIDRFRIKRSSPSPRNLRSPLKDEVEDLEETVIDFVLTGLLQAYPAAMISPDANGQIPFEAPLADWVDNELEIPEDQSPARCRKFSSEKFSSVTALWQRTMGSPGLKIKRSENLSIGDEEKGTEVKLASTESFGATDRYFPSHVKLSPGACYSITLLSAIIDKLDVGFSKGESSTFMSPTRSLLQEKRSDQASSLALLKDTTAADIRSEIIHSIASIPGLLKVILLTEDEDQRNFLMSSTIIKSVIAHEASMGTWFTNMIQTGQRHLVGRAMEYMELVSADKFWSEVVPPSVLERNSNSHKKQEMEIQKMRTVLYDKVSSLPNFVPSLLSLRGKEIEEASTTNLVRRVLDRIISRPFCATIVFCDALFLAIMIAGFRMAVHRLIQNESPGSILSFVYVANIGIFYFVIRELGKAVSLSMTNRRTRLYFLSFWNATDLLATFLPLVSTVAIRFQLTDESEEDPEYGVNKSLRYLLTLTTGFLWLRVLSFLKGINMQLATFVLAILQISRDVIWFCVILITLLISFGQMFFTLMAPDTCGIDAEEQTCSQSEYYLKMYSMLIFQEFDRESFDSVISVILVVLYSFMVVLVLLNVLIAVASDSYEKCLLRSQHLFGRARIMMISEMVSFQHLLRQNSGDNGALEIYKTWWSKDAAAGWSRASMVFFSLSSVVVLLWIIAEFAGYLSGPGNGNVIMRLASVLVTVILFICIMFFLAVSAENESRVLEQNSKTVKKGSLRDLGGRFESMLHNFVLRLLGTSVNEGLRGSSAVSAENEWSGRIHYLENTIQRIAETQRELTSEHFEKVESSLREEVASLEQSFQELKQEVSAPVTVNPDDIPALLASAIDALQKVQKTLR